jgi:type II secretory pathway component PulK
MKFPRTNVRSGIALIIVMICIAALSILAGGFAYSMKVETKLAMNARAEGEFLGLAQSAVDYCKAVLAITCPEEPFDALTQFWAGGTGSLCSNELFSVAGHDVDLGYGRFTWKMEDRERRANINIASQAMLDQAMRLIGIDGAEADALTGEILDWIDRDDNPRLNSVESFYYETLDPPYRAKNAFMDDISELKLLRSMTPEIYGDPSDLPPPPPPSLREQLRMGFPEEYRPVATLKDLFTPISGGPININTASAEVLQLVPFIDANTAQRIVEFREQQPFRNVGEGLLAAGLNQQIGQQIQNMFSVRSATFEAQITAEIKGVKRYYTALIRRNNPRDIQVLALYWKLKPFDSHADTP